MGMERKLAAVGLAAGMVVFGAGCGGGSDSADNAAEKLIEESTGGDVEVNSDDGSYTFTDEDGNTYEASTDGEGAALPDDWPADLAPPDDVTIVTASSNTVDGKQSMTVLAEAEGTVEEWAGGIKSQLEEAGYTIENDTTTSGTDGDYAGLSASGEYDVFASVTTSSDSEGKVTMTLTLTEASS